MNKILLIEDYLPLLNNLKEYLVISGYTVISFKSGEEALKYLKKETPDLILSDIKLPRINGYELLKTVKSKLKTVEIPFVFFTAKSEEKDRKKGLSQGADAYLIKPFTLEKMKVTIEHLL